MSQHSIEIQRLEAECRQKREEARLLEARLKQARSSISAASANLDPALVNYPAIASHPSLAGHAHVRSRSNTVPRGATAAGVPAHMGLKVEQGHSQTHEQSRPMKKSKTTHHVAAPASSGTMARSASNTSSMPTTRTMPFAANRHVAVPALPPSSYSESERLQVYLKEDQYKQPVNALIQAESFYAQPLGREFAVAEYLSLVGDDDVSGLPATAPMPIPTSTLLLPESAQFSVNSAIPSACGSMTSGPTIETAPMTRSNSTMNDNISISGQFAEMVRIHSDRSYPRQDMSGHAQAMHQPSLLGKRSMGEADFMAYQYGSSAPPDPSLYEHQHAMIKSDSQGSASSSSSAGLASGNDFNSQALSQHLSMERSVSNTSIRSNRSLGHRAREALNRQNANAASRNLKPKPASDVCKKESPEANLDKGKDGKAVIAKAKYERPKHPKVKCNQCNENPEGFRGDHELRRHTEAKHRSTVKKWICRDPAEAMIPHTEKAIKPLKDCKQCSQQKQYGAYYNAAAHLRRTHFKVKPPRKSTAGSKSGSKGQQGLSRLDDEKRGGKGGGDWPSMAELKLWMVEISVNINQIEGALDRDDVESVGGLDLDEIDGELGETVTYGDQANLGAGLGQDTYGMATAYAGGGFTQEFDSDISYHTLQGDLGSHTDLYLDTTSYVTTGTLQDIPISSSRFDFNSSSSHSTQHHIAPSMMSVDSNNYTSPVSSTATLTQGGVYGDHLLASQSMHHDDLDMSFDLVYQ